MLWNVTTQSRRVPSLSQILRHPCVPTKPPDWSLFSQSAQPGLRSLAALWLWTSLKIWPLHIQVRRKRTGKVLPTQETSALAPTPQLHCPCRKMMEEGPSWCSWTWLRTLLPMT